MTDHNVPYDSSDGKYIFTSSENDLVQVWNMDDRKVVVGVRATIHGLVVWLLIHTALYRTQMTMESQLYSVLVLSVRYLHRAITIVYAFPVENIVFKHDEKTPNVLYNRKGENQTMVTAHLRYPLTQVMGTVAYVGPEYIQTGD
ncbi:hypothetical protein ACFE04_029043 [Oxalis oulophora]